MAMLGEFVGTFLFLFFSFSGTQIANTPAPADGAGPNTSNLMFIALCFGLSLMANVWAFYRITGGLFNPSVSGFPPPASAVIVSVLLISGEGNSGSVPCRRLELVPCLARVRSPADRRHCRRRRGLCALPGPMVVNTTLGGGASTAQGLFIEVFLTAELVFVILMLAVEKHRSTFLAPIAIGISFFLAELCGKPQIHS